MRPFASILCVVTIVFLTGPAMASPMVEAPDSIYLPVAGSINNFTIGLTDVENGLSGYNFTLDLFPQGTAEIVSVMFPKWANMPMNGTMPAENTWIQAVDFGMQVEPGELSVILATITIRASTGGETILVVVPNIVDDDQGGRYVLDSLRIPVQVGVVPAETVTPTSSMIIDASLSSYENKTNETTAVKSPLHSPSEDLPFDEQNKPPAEATPGFDCITSCLAGLLICAIFLSKKIKW